MLLTTPSLLIQLLLAILFFTVFNNNLIRSYYCDIDITVGSSGCFQCHDTAIMIYCKSPDFCLNTVLILKKFNVS
jgi:hypothetical protein